MGADDADRTCIQCKLKLNTGYIYRSPIVDLVVSNWDLTEYRYAKVVFSGYFNGVSVLGF